MFDDAKADLIDALSDDNVALPLDDALGAIDGANLLAEQAIDEHATVETRDGQDWVVAVGDREYPLPDDVGGEDAATAATDGGAAAADAADDAQDLQTPRPPSAPAQQAVGAAGDTDTPAVETHELPTGLRVDVDPDALLVGEPTGDEIKGMPVLENHHPEVPETHVDYTPVDVPGTQSTDVSRDTEDLFYRAMALDKPVIFEGEHGTGKNQAVDSFASVVNLPVYRQEFGADITVMDMVGEKDLDGRGGTYYILGKAAKAALFGGIYLADEIAMAEGSVTSYLHPLFEDPHKRELELRGTGITLKPLPAGEEWDPAEHLGRYIHPSFRAVGTTNPLGYADVSEMNDALRSRCTVIPHPHLAESEGDTDGIRAECELLAEETGCDPDDDVVETLVRTAAVLREARREADAIQTAVGHRELRDAIDLAGPDQQFMSLKEAALVELPTQAQLKSDQQYIRDAIEDEM